MDRPNVDPKSWGPVAWKFLEAVFMSYPTNPSIRDEIWMIDFLTVLGDALPCEKCRMNYKEYMRTHPVRKHVAGRASTVAWMDSYKLWARGR